MYFAKKNTFQPVPYVEVANWYSSGPNEVVNVEIEEIQRDNKKRRILDENKQPVRVKKTVAMNRMRTLPEDVRSGHLAGSDYCIVNESQEPDIELWEDIEQTFVEQEDGSFLQTFSVVERENATELRKAHIAAKRYEVEVGGITISEMPIPTDRHTQQVLSAMYVRAVNDENYSVNFKTEVGFVQLGAAQIIQIAIAVHDHIQAAFAREAELLTLLETESVSGYNW